MIQQVILVNEMDQELGAMEKLEAHQKGLLHRAFSVFIFNRSGEMLLQKRALEKYHSAGLWSNACCSHPAPGEVLLEAAMKRLEEEMGFITPLLPAFDFTYRAEFENGLTEYEFDHVFAGEYEGPVLINQTEVMDYAYRPMSVIRKDLEAYPQNFTAWFHLAFPDIMKWWEAKYRH